MADKRERVVLIPFMAQGHLIPFLALALRLEKTTNYSVIFVNTPLNIKKLKSSLPENSSVQLLEIPFNSSDYGLPPGTENTDSLPYNLVLQFLQSSLALKPTFRKLISDLAKDQTSKPPFCLITDMFFSWCAEIAHEFGIFHSVFCAGGGFGFACFYSVWMNLPHRNLKSDDEFLLPDFPEAGKMHTTSMAKFLREASVNDPLTIFEQNMLSEWSNADGILVNTMEDFDRLGLMYFRRKLGRPVWAIGPAFLPSESRARTQSELCNNWLDKKPVNSVLYICFGSQNTVSASNLMNLAMALERSGKFFIWVVRPPLGFEINSEFRAEKWLPEGFEERIRESGRGLLVHKWAPQLEILSHKSVGAFLSHCGWNSLLEGLNNGVPIIGWPMAAEQFYNAKFLEEVIGVCVEIGRGNTCEIGDEFMARKIELVMNETEKGREMRRKASEVKEMMKEASRDEGGLKGSSVSAMDEFLNAALSMRKVIKD